MRKVDYPDKSYAYLGSPTTFRRELRLIDNYDVVLRFRPPYKLYIKYHKRFNVIKLRYTCNWYLWVFLNVFDCLIREYYTRKYIDLFLSTV